MSLLLFTGEAVVAPDGSFGADVPVRNEKIVAVGMDISEDGVETLDAHRKLPMLGFIDDHTPRNMPFDGTVTADDWASGAAATAAGGTTTIGDFALQEEDGALVPVADIVLWDPQLPIAATVQNRHGNVDYTPHEGMTFTGDRPRCTCGSLIRMVR